MTADAMIARREGHVGWMIFDHPARHNALTDIMCEQAVEILDDYSADPSVRLCVMAGAGEKAFVSGADIGGLSKTIGQARTGPPPAMRLFQALSAFEKPLIAMVRGWCLGGGMAVAMKADLRICADDARFGIPAARLGVGYPMDSMRDLVALAGPSAAKSILFTARRLDAQEALRLGLADEVVAPDALAGRVAEIAQAICENAPLSIRAAKAAIDHLARGAPSAEHAAALAAACAASEDFREGREAFMAKRPPVFRGV